MQVENPDEETSAAFTAPTGGRTLGGGSVPQPIPTTSSAPAPSSSRNKQAPQKKFATLGDLGGGAHAGHGHDDDDDDSDYDEKQDLFAGGEKSALAVQNPEDLKKKIVTRAKQYVTVTREIATPKANGTKTTEICNDLGVMSLEVRHPALLELHVHLEETTRLLESLKTLLPTSPDELRR